MEETPVNIPKKLAQEALGGFSDDVMLYKGLSANPELLEKLATVDGVALDPEDMQRRSVMYSKINATLHGKAGNAIEMGSMLEAGEIETAEQFLNGEIQKLEAMRNALRA